MGNVADLSGGCNNDWKDFDSAIVTTSRHYPLPPIRDHHFSPLQKLQQQQQPMGNGSLRVGPPPPHHHHNNHNHHDFNSAFTNFTQQLPTTNNYNSNNEYSVSAAAASSPHLGPNNTTTTQPTSNHLSWFTSELTNTQISSPPGFRNTNQTSKQQEC